MTLFQLQHRDTFDDVADSYDSARPAYPERLVDDLLAYATIGPSTRVLEIGSGPGLFTIPLARSGAQVLALELGHRLAAVAAQRLQPWSNATVQVADFDLWSPPSGAFDVVVAATAFHWLDPNRRVQKCCAALKNGGVIAIIDTHWGVGHHIADFSLAIQPCYETYDPTTNPDSCPRRFPTCQRNIANSQTRDSSKTCIWSGTPLPGAIPPTNSATF